MRGTARTGARGARRHHAHRPHGVPSFHERGRPDREPAQPVRAAQAARRRPTASTGTHAPDPQSQSFSRSYGSILPTSLIYILLSTRGCSPWRPDAVLGTTRRANNSLPQIFKGPRPRSGHPTDQGAFPAPQPHRRVIRFRGGGPLTRKENSSRGSRRRLWVRLRHRTRRARRESQRRSTAPQHTPLSTAWCRNLDRLPFRPTGGPARSTKPRAGRPPKRPIGVCLGLRIDSPMANCCSHGTLLHFSLQSSHLNSCYYHQDLH